MFELFFRRLPPSSATSFSPPGWSRRSIIWKNLQFRADELEWLAQTEPLHA